MTGKCVTDMATKKNMVKIKINDPDYVQPRHGTAQHSTAMAMNLKTDRHTHTSMCTNKERKTPLSLLLNISESNFSYDQEIEKDQKRDRWWMNRNDNSTTQKNEQASRQAQEEQTSSLEIKNGMKRNEIKQKKRENQPSKGYKRHSFNIPVEIKHKFIFVKMRSFFCFVLYFEIYVALVDIVIAGLTDDQRIHNELNVFQPLLFMQFSCSLSSSSTPSPPFSLAFISNVWWWACYLFHKHQKKKSYNNNTVQQSGNTAYVECPKSTILLFVCKTKMKKNKINYKVRIRMRARTHTPTSAQKSQVATH